MLLAGPFSRLPLAVAEEDLSACLRTRPRDSNLWPSRKLKKLPQSPNDSKVSNQPLSKIKRLPVQHAWILETSLPHFTPVNQFILSLLSMHQFQFCSLIGDTFASRSDRGSKTIDRICKITAEKVVRHLFLRCLLQKLSGGGPPHSTYQPMDLPLVLKTMGSLQGPCALDSGSDLSARPFCFSVRALSDLAMLSTFAESRRI